jgi:phage gp46-like protein
MRGTVAKKLRREARKYAQQALSQMFNDARLAALQAENERQKANESVNVEPAPV